MAKTDAAPRTQRLSVSLTPAAYERVKTAAEDMGLSMNSWAAYTLASAAASQAAMRAKMTDGMVDLLKSAIAEGVESGELSK
jgi:hypothetical protein